MHGRDTFAVRVEDDAMVPAFRDGDYVWVDPDEPMVDGGFVGVRDPRTGRKVVRRLGRESGHLVLRTLNPPGVERELLGDEVMEIEGAVVFSAAGCRRAGIRGGGAAAGVSGILVSWSPATKRLHALRRSAVDGAMGRWRHAPGAGDP